METQTLTPSDYETHRRNPGPSWPLLLTMTLAICGTASLMHRNVYYTDGPILQALYGVGIGCVALMLLAGFKSQTLAGWLVVLSGVLSSRGKRMPKGAGDSSTKTPWPSPPTWRPGSASTATTRRI